MDIKQKIYKLKQRSIEIATLALTLLPVQSGASASNRDKNINDDKKVSTPSQILDKSSDEFLNDNIELCIADFKKILDDNPDIKISHEFLKEITPGPSQHKIKSILSKGFKFTIKNSYGIKKHVSCSLNQSPKGYCAGAIKRLLNKVYNEPISGNLSAYQEKNNLLKSKNFLAIPIELQDIENCPINSIVVIPKCTGHKHGHIFTVVDKGVYCSDGKETAGAFFNNNYKDAKGIYAFIPVDGTIKLSPQLLQQSSELFAAIKKQQTDKDLQLISGNKNGDPILYANLISSHKDKDLNR